MSERIRQLAKEVARSAPLGSSHPKLTALSALRGDLSALQRELVEETAYSMGRAARRLEEGLAELRLLDDEIARLDGDGAVGDASAEPRPERTSLVERFNEKREDVLLRLHYVRIQREALGFLRHEELDKHYPVPSKRA